MKDRPAPGRPASLRAHILRVLVGTRRLRDLRNLVMVLCVGMAVSILVLVLLK